MMRYRLKVMAGYDIKIGHIITYRMRLNVITMKKKGNRQSIFLFFILLQRKYGKYPYHILIFLMDYPGHFGVTETNGNRA